MCIWYWQYLKINTIYCGDFIVINDLCYYNLKFPSNIEKVVLRSWSLYAVTTPEVLDWVCI